jgi:signal transduction histidine kinase
LLILISAVAAIATSFLAWRRAYQPARYFFIAWSIPLMGAIIFALAQFGILPLNIVTQQSPRLGLVFMVSLLSVALADQINIIRRQREDALVRVERLNQDLEGRVAVRTAELETSNRHLTEVIVDLEWAETALKQQALQLEALRQIALEIAGELELPVLLQSVVFHAVELMRTRRGSLFLWQPEREVLEMVTTTAEPVVDVGTTLRSGEGLTGQVWASGKPMMTNNYRQWPGRVEAIAKRIQPTAILGVPIVWHDERMGVLIIADHSDRNFVDEDVQLLKLFATQAAVAIQNGRLLAQVQNHTQVLEAEIFERRQAQDALQHYRGHLEELVEARTNELEVANRQLAQHNRVLLTLHAASLAVTSSLNLQEVLNTVTHEMAQLLDITICDVLTWDRQARTITIVAGYRLSGQLIEEEFETYDLSRYCLSEQVLLEKFVAQMTISQPDLDPGEREYMQAAGTKTLLMMPILFHNHSIGMITLEDQNVERTFTEEEIGLAQLFSYQAANAIENARHYAQAQQLIAELEVKNAELEQFTYIVSHDLKSPLITVKGFLGFLEKDAFHGDMGKVKQDIERIRDATMKMEQLLNDLLELSRIGRLVNPPQPVPFYVLAEEAVKLVAGPIAAGGVQVKIAPDMAVVYVDRVRLVEALQNLTDNAVKFMGDQAKPVIDIGVENGDDEPIFFVRDNGIGIEPKYHDKVFGLFDRLDSAVAGTGIGLALVKRIIEVHNGRIWIESDGNKNGTTIYFTLPTTANQQED